MNESIYHRYLNRQNMKKIIIPFCFLVLLLASCTEKNNATEQDAVENPEVIIQIEKETQEIESLDEKINNDIKEIDALLEDI